MDRGSDFLNGRANGKGDVARLMDGVAKSGPPCKSQLTRHVCILIRSWIWNDPETRRVGVWLYWAFQQVFAGPFLLSEVFV